MNKSNGNTIKKTEAETAEFAEVIEWAPKWCTGAPMPQVFSSAVGLYLIYLIDEPDPQWDGTYVTLIDNASENKYPLGLVEFNGGTFRFGIANDEVFSGLSLWDRGLKPYEAHMIVNSTWINELKNINKVHPYYKEDNWKDEKHFMFLFHDEILEVIARGYKIEIFNSSFGQLAAEVARRMNEY